MANCVTDLTSWLIVLQTHKVLWSVTRSSTRCASDQDVPMLAAAEDAVKSAGSKRPRPQTKPSKARLALILQHADQVSAAMAVLAALYAVKPIRQLLSELPQEQQLQAALLADMWQVPEVTTAAVKLLVRSLESGSTLSAAAYDQFVALEAMPSCLLPLFQKVVTMLVQQQQNKAAQTSLKRMLLSVLGDLEEVWAGPALRNTLLALPLPAVTTLLGSSFLKVASEDNVLYTAQAYMDSVADLQQRQTAQQVLAPVICAQHLSHLWLSAAALLQAPRLLVGTYQRQLRQLLLLKAGNAGSNIVGMQTSELQKLPGAPSSWVVGKRALKQAREVSLKWELSVSTLSSTARLSAGQQQLIIIDSPVQTPPLSGVAFGLAIHVAGKQEAPGTSISVYVVSKNMPTEAYFSYDCDLGVDGVKQVALPCPMGSSGASWGRRDFFGVGTMVGRWDAAAWAKQGLPADGKLVFTLEVKKLSHAT